MPLCMVHELQEPYRRILVSRMRWCRASARSSYSQAISRAEAAEKNLQAAERQGRRLRDQNETMVVELQVRARRSLPQTG